MERQRNRLVELKGLPYLRLPCLFVCLEYSSGLEYAVVNVLRRLASHLFIANSRRSLYHSVIDAPIHLVLLMLLWSGAYCLGGTNVRKNR